MSQSLAPLVDILESILVKIHARDATASESSSEASTSTAASSLDKAQILRAKGNLAEARQEAEKAANLDGGKHAEVSRILKQLQDFAPSAH